jgi:hypothetical protein
MVVNVMQRVQNLLIFAVTKLRYFYHTPVKLVRTRAYLDSTRRMTLDHACPKDPQVHRGIFSKGAQTCSTLSRCGCGGNAKHDFHEQTTLSAQHQLECSGRTTSGLLQSVLLDYHSLVRVAILYDARAKSCRISRRLAQRAPKCDASD